MKNIIIKSNISIQKAMSALDETSEKCLLVIDNDKKLLGTLTDGDIRRSILHGMKFSADVSSVYNKKPVVLSLHNKKEEGLKLLQKYRLNLIPVVDPDNVVVDYVTYRDFDLGTSFDLLNNIPVVIMAGGKGSRLDPFTKILPKPLVPIKDKPIIEHIVNSFMNYGCKNYYLTINYKAEIIKAYFKEIGHDYSIEFIKEDHPLGTAGSLRLLIDRFSQPFFVTNCDIIINTDYISLYDFHIKGEYDITLVASSKEYQIPYGTCKINQDGHLMKLEEKPKYNLLINTGLYILNPSVLELIPEKKIYHITELIGSVKDEGKNVGVYPVEDDAWIDVGEWTEYKKAINDLSIY